MVAVLNFPRTLLDSQKLPIMPQVQTLWTKAMTSTWKADLQGEVPEDALRIVDVGTIQGGDLKDDRIGQVISAALAG